MMLTSLILVALLGATDVQALIDAGQWDEAEMQLESVSPAARPRFEGVIAQGRGESVAAAEAFERALKLTPEVPELHLHAAHAYLSVSRFAEALEHARAAESLRQTAIAQPLLEARALDGLERHDEAYAVLFSACDVFSDEVRPWLELAVLAHRRGLDLEVRRVARELLGRRLDRATTLSLFHLLYDDKGAIPLLEQLVASHQGDAELRAHLGHAYARQRRWFSAARLFEEATVLGGAYAFEAADQYRMAGRFREALRLNGMVPKSDAQGVQRLAILFEEEQYARIVAMDATPGDPASRYRVAYAHYALGDHAGATDRARALLSTPYNDAAASLLQAMGRHHAEPQQ